MKVVLLGTGGPRPDPRRNATTTLIRHGDENILFDAGRGVAVQLVKAGVPLWRSIRSSSRIIISIISATSTTSCSATWMGGRKDALQIYGPPETERIVNTLVTQVYDKDIYWRATGEPALGGWKPVVAKDVIAGPIVDVGRWRVRAETVNHGDGLDIPRPFLRALDVPWLSVRGRRQGDRDQR